MPLEIIQALAKSYAFTLRRTTNPKYITRETYLLYFKDIFEKNKILIQNHYFEETAGLHCHGTILIPTKFNLKKLRVRGWNIKIIEVFDHISWTNYITKDQPVPDGDDGTPVPPEHDICMPLRKLFSKA